MGEVKDALLQRTRQGWDGETEPLRLDWLTGWVFGSWQQPSAG